MDLDIRTLTIVLFLVSIMASGAMLLVYLINGSQNGPLRWSVGSLLAGLGFIAMALEPWIGNYAIFLNNSLLLLALFFLFEGILRYQRIGKTKARYYAMMLIYLLSSLLLFLYKDTAMYRYLIFDFLMVILMVLCGCFILYGTKGKSCMIHLAPALFFFLYAPFFAYRWYLALRYGCQCIDFNGILMLFAIPWLLGWTLGLGLAYIYRINERLAQVANRDQLTGLENRRSLDNISKLIDLQGEGENEEFALFLLDINGFKKINDTYGHGVGDEVLKLTAKAILSTIREGDLAIRFGGDEFIVLLRNPDHNSLGSMKERIREQVERDIAFDQWILHLRVSIGQAIFPEDSTTLEKLILLADSRMYQEKEIRLNATTLTLR